MQQALLELQSFLKLQTPACWYFLIRRWSCSETSY